MEPRKQEELGKRLLPLLPFPLPFGLLTSPPAASADVRDDEEEEEEEEVVALLLPDPITHQHQPTPPAPTDPRIGPDRSPLLRLHASLPRDGAWVRVAACATPRRLGGREWGTSAAVASFVFPQTLA